MFYKPGFYVYTFFRVTEKYIKWCKYISNLQNSHNLRVAGGFNEKLRSTN